MNLKRGFRRIVLILATLAGIICGVTAFEMQIDKRSSALRHLAECKNEFVLSIPVGEKPAGWERYTSSSVELSLFLYNTYLNLPMLSGEEDKKYREEHNIPPDSPNRFYTDESVEFMRKYGSCVKKAESLIWAPKPQPVCSLS